MAVAALRGRHVGQVRPQLGIGVYALVAHPLDEPVQHVDGGAGMVVGAVGGGGGGREQPRQCRQFHAGRLVAGQHPPRQPYRAQHRRPRPGDVESLCRRPQEPDIEPGVVRDEHRAPGELQERGQHGLDAGCVVDHRRGDAGQLNDLRRDAAARVDQGGQLAEHHAAADLDRADLGDRVMVVPAGCAGVGTAAGGLLVHHDERGVGQCQIRHRVHIGEAQLLHTGDGRPRRRQPGSACRSSTGVSVPVVTVPRNCSGHERRPR